MKTLGPRTAALDAVASSPTRAATALLYDSPGVRMVVFRLEPAQAVPLHSNQGTVILNVIEGHVMLASGRDGEEREQRVAPGGTVVYEPNEPHGMRAVDERVLLLATIVRAASD